MDSGHQCSSPGDSSNGRFGRSDVWPLFEERYVALLARAHPLASRLSIGIEDLQETAILERAGCDVALLIQRSCFPEEPLHLSHCSGHDLHLLHLAAAGLGVILAPEHMPYLPTLKAIPIEGDPVWREVRLLAVQGRRYAPATAPRRPSASARERIDDCHTCRRAAFLGSGWASAYLWERGVLVDYFDRINLSVGGPQLQQEFVLIDGELGWLFSADSGRRGSADQFRRNPSLSS